MTFKFTDATRTLIRDTVTGRLIPVDPDNPDYAGAVAAGIEDPTEPGLTLVPSDHYWKVGTTPGWFSSASRGYVGSLPAPFLARSVPSIVADEATLWPILGRIYPDGLPDGVTVSDDILPESKFRQRIKSDVTAAASAASSASSSVTTIVNEIDAIETSIAAIISASDGWDTRVLPFDEAVTTVAPAALPGMTFDMVGASLYWVEVLGMFRSAAGTTGMGMALDVPAGAAVVGATLHPTSATAAGMAYQNSDAGVGATTGVPAISVNLPVNAAFLVNSGIGGGTCQLMLRSEVANSAVTALGSAFVMRAKRVAALT